MTLDQLSQAQDAIRQGDKATARVILRKVIMESPSSAQAWFLMAQAVEERERVVDCLQIGLRLDPSNQAAQKAFAVLTQKQDRLSSEPTETPLHPSPPSEDDFLELAEDHLQTPDKETITPRNLRINWPLLIGAVIVFLVSMIALVGPKIAPGDPLEENVIVKINDVWEIPPLPPFQFKEYLLGTDQFGRDLLSRILWAVQPTLVMVMTVALFRLFFGTLIGLAAGWTRGALGHWLDILITGALAVPVFIVALGTIALLGAEMGIMAFVIGFSINGWGETARIVREQTEAIRENLFVEAAQALGASQGRVVFGHVLRQIMPMIWMLLAFEISNTLMVTAGLGFLGYYIGGDVWIEVGDFVSRRVSGMPELGQMLATSWTHLTKPWPMVITGTVIFITILGFNLLGEGLRASLNPEIVKIKNPFKSKFQRFTWWWEEQAAVPAGRWARAHVLLLTLIGVFIVILLSGFYGWRTQYYPKMVGLNTVLPVPGEHDWAAERGDPYGTYWTNTRGPDQPSIEWQLQMDAGFAGGPVVTADRIIYIGVNDGRLLALQADSQIIWEASLPEIPVGPPALSADGVVYIGDQEGGLTAVSPEGKLLWHFQQDDVGEPVHGPIVDLDGNIYYLLDDPKVDHLISLTPSGDLRWSIKTGTRAADVGPRLSPDGDVIFLKNLMINAQDGDQIEVETPADQDPVLSRRAQYLVGADGNKYLAIGHTIVQWQPGDNGFEVVQSAEWDYTSSGFNLNANFPQDAGVTPNQVVWLFYSWRYGGTKMVWVDISGRLLGISYTPLRQRSKPVAIDNTNAAFLCGVEDTPAEHIPSITKCLAFDQGSEEPKWELILNDRAGNHVIGTAMSAGKLYVVTENGFMYAIEQVGGENTSQDANLPVDLSSP